MPVSALPAMRAAIAYSEPETASSSSGWWTSGGISAANVVWAFDAANAANEAASYTDQSSAGNDATETDATGWTSGTGWNTFGRITAPNGGITGSDNRTVIVKAGRFSSNNYVFALGTNSTGTSFRIRNDAGYLRFELQGSGYTSSLAIGTGPHVIAVRLNGTTLADVDLFVDGTKESCTGTNTVATSDAVANIGDWEDVSVRSFEGDIYQIVLYDTALSDAEIAAVDAEIDAL